MPACCLVRSWVTQDGDAMPNIIGPHTVDLVFRDPAPGVDDNGQPNRVDRIVAKVNSNVTVTSVIERRETGAVAVHEAKAALPVDSDTQALTAVDAIRHDGRVYELTADATTEYRLAGPASHVRVFGSNEEPVAETREITTITPKFGRDDEGQPLPDGVPVDVFARGVDPGNTAKHYGVSGELDEADFTVAYDLDAPVKDGDIVTVRGRRGYARVQKHLEQWADRSQLIVTVSTRYGGRR
jgi:hypothetical protein